MGYGNDSNTEGRFLVSIPVPSSSYGRIGRISTSPGASPADESSPPWPVRLVQLNLVGDVIFPGQLFAQAPRQVACDECHHHGQHSVSPE